VIVLTEVPPLFVGLVDDAAVFPPGSAPLADALAEHGRHRQAWYEPLVGPLLLPADLLAETRTLLAPAEHLAVGVIGELPAVTRALDDRATDHLLVHQVEVPVAKRQQDPLPGLAALVEFARRRPDLTVYAEIPLTLGLLSALDEVAAVRAGGLPIAPKFRTGGLAAELFPTPVELAAVICACRDRELPFKLTAGLHHALRHNDAETGFVHHGFLNVLAAAIAAAAGAEVHDVAGYLASTDHLPLVELVRPRRGQQRPLWIGFGSCSIADPLEDLRRLGLLYREVPA
jgi:hypothetical protein